MKITDMKTYFSGQCHYLQIFTDEGIVGLGEATLHTRQLAVEGVLEHIKPVLMGQDPMRTEYLWQDVFHGNFWRGGPVLMSALSAVDMALWDIKGKYLNTPVYNLLGGKVRDKMKVYISVGGKTPEEAAQNGLQRVAEGYRVLRICPSDHAVQNGIFEPYEQVRIAIEYVKALREAVGDSIEIILENHTRFAPSRALQLAKGVEPYRLFFIEDPTRSDTPEAFRLLRAHTDIPLGTGEKAGPLWDYKCLIEEDLIDYVRTDICNCGGITQMMKIAHYAESHYMEMVPHGVHHVGFLAAMHCNFATQNFNCQEDWLSREHPEWLDYDVKFENGFMTMADRPGLGIELDTDKLQPFVMREHNHWRREDGTVQDW